MFGKRWFCQDVSWQGTGWWCHFFQVLFNGGYGLLGSEIEILFINQHIFPKRGITRSKIVSVKSRYNKDTNINHILSQTMNDQLFLRIDIITSFFFCYVSTATHVAYLIYDATIWGISKLSIWEITIKSEATFLAPYLSRDSLSFFKGPSPCHNESVAPISN